MAGTDKTYFTVHGIIGYSALAMMVIDAVLIWRHKMTTRPRNSKRLAFTLVELMVVLTVIGILPGHALMHALTGSAQFTATSMIGMIALAGLDAETGVVMLLYLDLAYERWKAKGKMTTWADLAEAVDHGAVQRIRPKAMTVTTTFIALLPILWATGTGADVMRRIAAPMVGGILTSFIGELLVYPSIYFVWRALKLKKGPLFPETPGGGEGLEPAEEGA